MSFLILKELLTKNSKIMKKFFALIVASFVLMANLSHLYSQDAEYISANLDGNREHGHDAVIKNLQKRIDAQVTSFEASKYAIQPQFQFLRFGEVKPEGWIKEQMTSDLKDGFAGRLDKLAKEAGTDIFVSGRNRTGKENTANIDQNHWWNGETEGNWRTGFIMLAYLSGNSDAIKQADLFVNRVLAAQDKNGYLGIFSDTLQYSRSGDLWTQTCLLRGLLAYSELSGKQEVLKAVERSVKLTIKTFGPGKRSVPLGETHDLMYTDVLEHLFNTTGDTIYRNFALWLYEDYYSKNTHKSELSLRNITNTDVVFTEHGVHAF